MAEVGGLLQVLDQLGLLHSYMAIRAAPISEEEEEAGKPQVYERPHGQRYCQS